MSQINESCLRSTSHVVSRSTSHVSQTYHETTRCHMTHVDVWHDAFWCVAWRMNMRYVRSNWLTGFDMRDITRPYAWHILRYQQWLSSSIGIDDMFDLLQCVAVCCSVLQCVAVCCSVLQCVAVCCGVLHHLCRCHVWRLAVCCIVLQCIAVCCSVLQCVAVCCGVLQCVAVCCSIVQRTCLTGLDTCDMTHPYAWHASFTRPASKHVTQFNHTCKWMGNDLFTCETWLMEH